MEFAKTVITLLSAAALLAIVLTKIYNKFFEGDDES